MPRRRRKDPDTAPIDGDFSLDQVFNKQKGTTYKWLSPDDIPKFKARGFVREERGPEAAHPAYDFGSEGDAGYQVGSLTLYKAPDEVAERFDRIALSAADARMADIARDVKRGPRGSYLKSQLQR